MVFFGYGAIINVKYNFWYDFRYQQDYYQQILITSIFVLGVQIGVFLYAFSMVTGYFSKACRNLHAIEETISGGTYNKALFWGIISETNTTP